MAEVLAVVALGMACAAWVLVQRRAERAVPGNPGVVRDCAGCPQPPEGEAAAGEGGGCCTAGEGER